MKPTFKCTKCSRPQDTETTVYPMQGACDLPPMKGYSGPCAAKITRGLVDLDDGEDGHTIASATIKSRGNRRGRKQPSSDRK